MTKEKLEKRYKEIEIKQIQKDILEVNLWKDSSRPFEWRIKILIAYDKLYYTGDFGTFVFGKYVNDIKTFFIGKEINPYYWMEKCEASSEPLLSEQVDLDKVREKTEEYLIETLGKNAYKNIEDEVDDVFWSIDSYYIRTADKLEDFFNSLEGDVFDGYLASQKACGIVGGCRDFASNYLYACEVIQWIENNLEKWDKEIL